MAVPDPACDRELADTMAGTEVYMREAAAGLATSAGTCAMNNGLSDWRHATKALELCNSVTWF